MYACAQSTIRDHDYSTAVSSTGSPYQRSQMTIVERLIWLRRSDCAKTKTLTKSVLPRKEYRRGRREYPFGPVCCDPFGPLCLTSFRGTCLADWPLAPSVIQLAQQVGFLAE